MASLAEVGRSRKRQLKQLLLASRRLDAAQEALEREAKRLTNRKVAVPEVADAQRLVGMTRAVYAALENLSGLLTQLAQSWSAF